MADSDKRIRIEGEEDRITKLPVNVKENILDRLRIKDAVATSILSSGWRYCWRGMMKLKFDEDFFGYDNSKLLARHRTIDRVLMAHSGPIREFIVGIPDFDLPSLDINLWLLVSSDKGVKKMKIKAYWYWSLSLTLPHDFKGFANLQSLSLCFTEMKPNVLKSLISGCLVLERLSLKYIGLMKPLALEAQNLKTFYFGGNKLSLENIIFKDTPKLTCVSLNDDNENNEDCSYSSESYSTLKLLCSISWIEELTFDFCLLEALSKNCPRHTSTLLENLKSLTLSAVNLCFSDHILFAFCLISSAPTLQSLKVYLDSDLRHRIGTEELTGAAAKLLESEAEKRIHYNMLKPLKSTELRGCVMNSC